MGRRSLRAGTRGRFCVGAQEQRADGRGVLTCAPLAPAELKATGTAHFFNFLLNSSDYRILLKDEDHDRMYVGSKDYVLSLDLHDINREPLIVSCCLLGHLRGMGRRGASSPAPHLPCFRRSTGLPPSRGSRSASCRARTAM